MTRAYRQLIRLYPEDIRFAYGDEMAADFEEGLGRGRRRGQAAHAVYVVWRLLVLFCDAAAERVSSLYSHRSFHGRCEPDFGVVRPPNMGKKEWFGLLVVGSLAAVTPVAAQDRMDPMAATIAQRFTMIQDSFISLADAMPADKYGFAPTSGEFKGVRTFGEQVKHVACSNFAFFNEIEKKQPPHGCDFGGPSPARTKAELMAYLRESFEYAQRVLRTMTAANALDPAGGPYGGDSTRLGLTTLAVWHASDHYGQLVVYLRMNGIVPPASQPQRMR